MLVILTSCLIGHLRGRLSLCKIVGRSLIAGLLVLQVGIKRCQLSLIAKFASLHTLSKGLLLGSVSLLCACQRLRVVLLHCSILRLLCGLALGKVLTNGLITGLLVLQAGIKRCQLRLVTKLTGLHPLVKLLLLSSIALLCRCLGLLIVLRHGLIGRLVGRLARAKLRQLRLIAKLPQRLLFAQALLAGRHVKVQALQRRLCAQVVFLLALKFQRLVVRLTAGH